MGLEVCRITLFGNRVLILSKDWGWFTSFPRGSFGVGLWKTIAKGSNQLKKDCVFKLGDGRKIRFWEDTWCGRRPLCGEVRWCSCLGSKVYEAF